MRNRLPRYAPELVDNNVLDNEMFEILSSTGSMLSQLFHWVSIRKDDGKRMPL